MKVTYKTILALLAFSGLVLPTDAQRVRGKCEIRKPDEEAVPPTGGRARESSIATPDDISEESLIAGYQFTEAYKTSNNQCKAVIFDAWEASGTTPLERAPNNFIGLAQTYTPVVRENYIRIQVGSGNTAKSATEKIWMWFGRTKKIGLLGYSNTAYPFPANNLMKWDLNSVKWYLETIDTDDWDMITLTNPSTDGIKIKDVKIVHSGVTILDWKNANVWLDNSKHESHSHLGLSAKILEHKLNIPQIKPYNWITQIHWAARELGKTDGQKYQALGTNAWCSEFASWVLRKALWNTPDNWAPNGIGDSQEMEDYFDSIGRNFPHSSLVGSGFHRLKAGDYLRFQWASGGHHSGIFISYRDSLNPNPTDSTRIYTIEGNTGSRVAVRTRRLEDVISAGNTQ